MATEQYSSDGMLRLFQQQKVAVLEELKAALGTTVDMTVFRRLRKLVYRTSYSHNGRYYTIDRVAEFDATGLWSFRSIWFSKHGTLLATAEACVVGSEAGYFAGELEAVLHVEVKDALRKLVNEDRISRETVTSRFLYCSKDPLVRAGQLRARHIYETEKPIAPLPLGPGVRSLPDELKAAIVLFFSLLDEKQRRLYAGLESLKLGHGGDQKVAELLGLDVGTVGRGRRQLIGRDVDLDRVRQVGGGRPSLEKKLPKSSSGSLP